MGRWGFECQLRFQRNNTQCASVLVAAFDALQMIQVTTGEPFGHTYVVVLPGVLPSDLCSVPRMSSATPRCRSPQGIGTVDFSLTLPEISRQLASLVSLLVKTVVRSRTSVENHKINQQKWQIFCLVQVEKKGGVYLSV